jgi:hypothetical protein
LFINVSVPYIVIVLTPATIFLGQAFHRMTNRLLNYTIVLLCCLFQSLLSSSQLQKIYLHPKANGTSRQSQFIDSIRFIPLEIREEIKLGQYFNIEVAAKFILLNDYSNSKYIIYSKEGKFIQKINYKKLGGVTPNYNEDKNQIIFFGKNKNYTLTPKDEVKIKLDWTNPANKKYFKKYTIDLDDPSFTIKKATPDKNDIIRSFHYYDDYYLQAQISTSPLYEDTLDYELKIYKNNELVKGFFPYNRNNEPRFLYKQDNVSFNRTDSPSVGFVARPYCDTVYKMVQQDLSPAYQLVLPLENTLPPSFYTKSFKNKTERDNFNRNNGWMLSQIYTFYETPKFIFLSVGYLSNFESYVYHKGTNVTYKAKNIKADSTQYDLQLMAGYNARRNGEWFYQPRLASELLIFFEKNKNATIPAELETFLKSKPHGTTPVVVEYKFKK